MADQKKTDKGVVVYQANPLVEGRRDFSLIETRLFYLGLRDLKPQLTNKNVPWNAMSIKDFPTTIISTKDLIDLFGNKKYYSTLKDICRGLIKKSVEIESEDEKGFSERPVFLDLTYKVDEGLRLVFSPFMIPYLLELADKQYTKIPFEQIWNLQSKYAVRLLELLLQYQNTKTHERTIMYEDLRRYLNVAAGEYTDRMNNFIRNVVDKPIKDINKNTSYKVEYEKVKDGRKVVGFKFKLHLPAELKAEKQKQKAKEALDIVAGLAQSKSMTPGQNNAPPALSKKRPMPVFLDKDGKRLEYEKPVRIKDGKVIV